MKKTSYSLLRTVCAFLVGLVLFLYPEEAGNYLVVTLGIIFLIPSGFSLIIFMASSERTMSHFPILGIGSFLFGLWLIIMPVFFADFLIYILGFILAVGGIQQVALLIASRRRISVAWGFYVVPILILLAGLVALFNPTETRSTIFIFIGISCMVYAVSELLNWFCFARKGHSLKSSPAHRLSDNAEDAELVE